MNEVDWKSASNKDWANSTVTGGLCMTCGLRGCGGHDFQTNYVRADPPEINLKPHLCPVCLGKTAVPGGFYNLDETITDAPQEKCASCNGAGYILCL